MNRKLTVKDFTDFQEEFPDILVRYRGSPPLELRRFDLCCFDLPEFDKCSVEDNTPLYDTVLEWVEGRESSTEESKTVGFDDPLEAVFDLGAVMLANSKTVEQGIDITGFDSLQDYIDNKPFFMLDEPLKGWAWDRISLHASENFLYSKDTREGEPDQSFTVNSMIGSDFNFCTNFSLTDPNTPKEPKYKPFEKLSEEQKLKYLFSAFYCKSEDKERGMFIIPLAVTNTVIRFANGMILDLDKLFKDYEVYDKDSKTWLPFGEVEL